MLVTPWYNIWLLIYWHRDTTYGWWNTDTVAQHMVGDILTPRHNIWLVICWNRDTTYDWWYTDTETQHVISDIRDIGLLYLVSRLYVITPTVLFFIHPGHVTHIAYVNYNITLRHQAIIWSNVSVLCIEHLAVFDKPKQLFYKKMNSAQWVSFCLVLQGPLLLT